MKCVWIKNWEIFSSYYIAAWDNVKCQNSQWTHSKAKHTQLSVIKFHICYSQVWVNVVIFATFSIPLSLCSSDVYIYIYIWILPWSIFWCFDNTFDCTNFPPICFTPLESFECLMPFVFDRAKHTMDKTHAQYRFHLPLACFFSGDHFCFSLQLCWSKYIYINIHICTLWELIFNEKPPYEKQNTSIHTN